MPRKRVVLAGGGHAHLYTLSRTKELVRRGYDVSLVDGSPHLYYSGMATGVISGAYDPDDHRIDTRRLVERGGGTFVEGRIREIRDGAFVLADGREIPYDAASVCLGSGISNPGVAEDAARTLPIKPVSNTSEIRERLLALSGDRTPRVLVVGGGAAGCEVAANTLAFLRSRSLEGTLTVAQGEDRLLPDAPRKAQEEILDLLKGRGAKVLTGDPVVRLFCGTALTSCGREIPYDLAVLAVGVSPPDVFRASGLPTDDGGGLVVDRHLRSTGDERLFGGGDCVSFRGRSLPKLGVFAVRQGPVIFHNLQATLEGSKLRAHRPQRRYLYVLNLGDGTGLAIYGRLSWRGRISWWLKHRIDERFVGEHGS